MFKYHWIDRIDFIPCACDFDFESSFMLSKNKMKQEHRINILLRIFAFRVKMAEGEEGKNNYRSISRTQTTGYSEKSPGSYVGLYSINDSDKDYCGFACC